MMLSLLEGWHFDCSLTPQSPPLAAVPNERVIFFFLTINIPVNILTPRVLNSESGNLWLHQKKPDEDKNTGSDSEPMTNAKYSNMAVAAVLLKLDGISLPAWKKVTPIKSTGKYIRFQPVQLKNIPFFQ